MRRCELVAGTQGGLMAGHCDTLRGTLSEKALLMHIAEALELT